MENDWRPGDFVSCFGVTIFGVTIFLSLKKKKKKKKIKIYGGLLCDKNQSKRISDILTLVAGDWLNSVGFRFSCFKEMINNCDVMS